MSWPSFYALGAAWLALWAIPLVLLYFLKLRRQSVSVPSLLLWRQVLEDHRVNSPFRRFRKNWLLWLQLLLLALVVLAAMQPYFQGDLATARRVLVLVDRSASMAAIDEQDRRSRMELARDELRRLIDALGPDQQMSIVAFDRSAQQLVEFTSDKRRLYEVLRNLQPRDVPGELAEVLRMAGSMARSTPFERAVLVSDGVWAPAESVYVPFPIDFRALPPGGMNTAITAASARRTPGGAWAVFARVQASDGPLRSGQLHLYQDGSRVGSEPVSLAGGESRRLIFPIDTSRGHEIELRLEMSGFDSLAADNDAFLVLTPPRPLRAFVSETLEDFRQALSGLDDIQVTAARGVNGATAGAEQSPAPIADDYDLIISDRTISGAHAAVKLYVGFVPEPLVPMIERVEQGDMVIDWRRTSPLLEHADMREVVLIDHFHWREDYSEADVEALGYEVLVHGRAGPLVLANRRGTGPDEYYLLFDPARSTLPYRVSFPILVSNLVQIASDRAGLLEVSGVRTGVLPPLDVPPQSRWTVTAPGGAVSRVAADDRGRLSAVAAPQAGIYRLHSDLGERRVGASLLTERESLLRPIDTETWTMAVDTVIATRPTQGNRSLWIWPAVLAIIVLAIEWWVFHRRRKR